MRSLSTHPRRFGGDSEPGEPRRVLPGQVWNHESPRGRGGSLLVISVDSAYAYCRDGRDGAGEPRRLALTRFDERCAGGLTLVATDEGLEDLVERRALTALWELDYVGSPTTTETICDVLGGYYSPKRVEAALTDAEADGLALRSGYTEGGEWRLTGGGRLSLRPEPLSPLRGDCADRREV